MSADPASHVQIIATNPIPTLTARWGESVEKARVQVENLTMTLRELDRIRDTLAEHGLTVATDLGPIGNAGQAARRTMEDHKKPAGFQMPRSA